MRRIALAVDAPERADWHVRRLLRAFTDRRAELVPLRLSDCSFDSLHPHGLALPGFGHALPEAMLVRTVAGGSFEEVTRRLGILHALARLNVPVWNEARAIERCVDKSTTTFLLGAGGVPTPPSWAVEGAPAARELVRREAANGKLVLKPLFGSQGRGLRLVGGVEDLPEAEAVGGVYYLQRYVPPRTIEPESVFRDRRVFVCNGAAIAGMVRRAPGWITNIGRGGAPERADPDPELDALAVRAAACVGAAYAGVDLLRSPEGAPMVLEVNSMPSWRGLQQVTEVSVADHLADALLASLR